MKNVVHEEVFNPVPPEIFEANQLTGVKRALIGFGVGVIAATSAGCSFDSSHSQRETKPSATTVPGNELDSLEQQIYDRLILIDKVDNKHADTDIARDALKKVEKTDHADFSDIKTAIDLVEASEIVDEASYDADEALTKVERVKDPAIKSLVNLAVDESLATDAVYHARFDIAEARKINAKVKDENKRKEASDAIDMAIAVDAASTSTTDPDEAKSKLKDIINPTIKSQAINLIDRSIAAKALSEITNPYSYNANLDEAMAIINALPDSDFKTEALALAKQGYNADFIDVLNLRNSVDDQLNQLRENDNEFGRNSNVKDMVSKKIDGDLDNIVKASSALITNEVKRHNNIAPQEVNTLPTGGKLSDMIDLSNVKGTKKVKSAYGDSEEPTTFHQFGEIYVEDGQVKLRYEAGSHLNEKTKKQLEAVFNRVKPLMTAAFATGDLLNVHLIIGDDYNPFYSPVDHQEYVVLPADDSTTVDQLNSGLIHETVHALVRNVFSYDENMKPSEIAELNDACTALANVNRDQLNTELNAYPELLNNLHDEVNPKMKPVVDQIIYAVKSGNIKNLLTLNAGINDEFSLDYNDCLPNGAQGLFIGASVRANVDMSDKDYRTMSKLPSFKTFVKKWTETEVLFDIYGKLNESSFTDTQYWGKEFLGHSQDNANELIASLTDAIISYPGKLGEMMQTMEPNEKQATIKAMRMSIDLITHRHPELLGYLSQVEAKILLKANQ